MVYDATHGARVNNWIRVLDKTHFPAWLDLVAYLDEMAGNEMGMHFSAIFDVSKAHRRIPTVRSKWGLLASRVGSSAGTVPADDDVLYVNSVAQSGSAAQVILAALLLRVIYVLQGADHPAYILLFSDDSFITRVGPAFHKTILLMFLILEIFSVPLSWKKVNGASKSIW